MPRNREKEREKERTSAEKRIGKRGTRFFSLSFYLSVCVGVCVCVKLCLTETRINRTPVMIDLAAIDARGFSKLLKPCTAQLDKFKDDVSCLEYNHSSFLCEKKEEDSKLKEFAQISSLKNIIVQLRTSTKWHPTFSRKKIPSSDAKLSSVRADTLTSETASNVVHFRQALPARETKFPSVEMRR